MKKYNLESKLNNYILDSRNANINFELANEYFDLGQYASAMSYYLRSAELSNNDEFIYESLLSSWNCIKQVGDRPIFERGQLKTIISQSPHRPEAYFFICNWLEKFGGQSFSTKEEKFQQIYLYACIGENNIDKAVEFKHFNKDEYPGYYGILFYKAFAGWQIGKIKESEDIFIDLYNNHKLNDNYKNYVLDNIINLKLEHRIKVKKEIESEFIYRGNEELRIPFRGMENIEKNYSGAYQDLFVLQCFNGKRNGTFLEIGAGDPLWGSNTYLLCDKFGWKGLSQDYDFNEFEFVRHDGETYSNEEYIKYIQKEWKEMRTINNPLLLKDALQTDYRKLVDEGVIPNVIDYLQLDIDPAKQTYKLLEKLPFEYIDFKIITYEHDTYNGGEEWREKSRLFLEEKGYKLVAGNIATKNKNGEDIPFEDWWVNLKYIDELNVKHEVNNKSILPVKEYMFKNKK